VKGLVFDWKRLYGERKPKRISLPTYPFARERYWIPRILKSAESPGYVQNISVEGERQFDEPFYRELLNSVIDGRASIPAAIAKAKERGDHALAAVEV
jgi:acyl transferase domain-containing protein